MKYFVNYDFHMLTIAKEKPAPIRKNRRYDHGLSEWTEISAEQYHELFEQFYDEALEA